MIQATMDIVNYVDNHYKTIAKRSARAVTGLSMGGGHTFGISRLYPNMFDYYGLQSAACRMPREIQPNTPNSKLNQDFDGQMARLL